MAKANILAPKDALQAVQAHRNAHGFQVFLVTEEPAENREKCQDRKTRIRDQFQRGGISMLVTRVLSIQGREKISFDGHRFFFPWKSW